MNDIQKDISGNEVYDSLIRLKEEREDIESVIRIFSNINPEITFSSNTILEHDINLVDFFENKVVFPIQSTRAYKDLSPELEKVFLFDLKHNDKQIITKAKKDFKEIVQALEKHRVDIVYETIKFIELGRRLDSFFLSDIAIDISNEFSYKHVVNFFANYYKISVVNKSFENEKPLFLFPDYKKVENGYKISLKISSESLIKNCIDINKFLDIISSGCSGAVKTDKMSVSISIFDNVSIFYKGYVIDNITKEGDYDLLSNKKKKSIMKIFNRP